MTFTRCLLASARFHQPQVQHVQSGKKRDYQQDPLCLSMDKTHQRLRARQKLRLKPISFVAEVSQDRAPKRRPCNRHETENSKVHSNNPGRNRDQMANDRKQPRKENTTNFVASEPALGAFQFLFAKQHETAALYDQRTSNKTRRPVSDGRTKIRP